MGRHVDNVLELAGMTLLVAFAYVVWAPAALLAAGVLLIIIANARSVARKRATEAAGGKAVPAKPWIDRLITAIAAYRRAGAS